jgi:hypothetical protein
MPECQIKHVPSFKRRCVFDQTYLRWVDTDAHWNYIYPYIQSGRMKWLPTDGDSMLRCTICGITYRETVIAIDSRYDTVTDADYNQIT